MAAALRILYVDDDSGLLEIGKLFLEDGGQFCVDTILSASDALSLLDQKNFDGIISDYQMPKMDGIEFLKRVRASGNTIPFILFTGRGREEVVIQALNEGADFYLQKGGEPVSQFAELAHKIRQAVQQRWAEKSIRDHEQREADIINFLPDATFAIDTNGVVIAWNRAMEDMTGVLTADILGKGEYTYALPFYNERRPILIDLVLKDDPATEAKYPYVLRSGKKLFSEIIIPQKNNGAGTLLWFTASPLYDTIGTIVGAIESIRDITDRKRAEEALRESGERLSSIFAAAQVGIVLIDAESHRIVEANQKALDMIGAPEPDVVGKTCHTFICPADQGACPVTDLCQKVDSSERVLLTRDGKQVPILKTVVLRQIGGRNVLVESFVDISDRKQSEDRLRFSERKFAAAFAASPDPVAITELATGVLLDINHSFETWSGYSRDESIGKTTRDLNFWVWPEERDAVVAELNAQKSVHKKDVTLRTKSGEPRSISFSANVFGLGKSRYMLSVAEDITDRKRADESLRETNEYLRNLIDSANAPIIVWDPQFRITRFNHAFENLTGRTEQDVLGKHLDLLFPKESRDISLEKIQKTLTGDRWESVEIPIIRKDGRTRIVLWNSANIQDSHNTIVSTIAQGVDVTELKQAEERRRIYNEHMRLAQEIGQIGSWELDIATGTIWASEEAFRIFAVPRPANGLISLDAVEARIPERQRVHQALADLLETGKKYDLEYAIEPDDKSDAKIVHSVAKILYDAGKKPVGIAGVIQDITLRIQAETDLKNKNEELHAAYNEIAAHQDVLRQQITEIHTSQKALAASEERYRLINDSSRDFIYSYDRSGRFTSANRSLCEALNLTPDQIIGRTHTELGFPELQCRDWDHLHQRVYASGATIMAETSTPMMDGRVYLFEVGLNPMHDADGTISGISGTTRDITARKQAEVALAESEAKYRTVLEDIQDIFYRSDMGGQLIMASPSWAALLGYDTVDECLGHGIADTFYYEPATRGPFLRAVQDQGRVDNYEVTLKRKDGSPVKVSTNSHLYYHEDGTPAGVEGIFRDITEIKQKESILLKNTEELRAANEQIAAAEEELRANMDELGRQEIALRESKKELEDIISFLPDATFAIDRSGRVIAWNLAIEKMTGIPAEQMLGKGDYEYALPFYGERRPILIDLIFRNDADLKNYSTVRRDGTTLIAETGLAHLGGKNLILWGKASPLYNPAGEIIGAIESIRDFTERRRIEDSLNQLNKKLSLLSSVTRHDIINNISVCMAYLALAKQKSPDAVMQKFITTLEECIEAIQSQIEFTRIYQDLGVTTPVWLDIREILGKCSAAPKCPVESGVSNLEVFADPLIGKVFYNLHDNTVRHGVHASAIRVYTDQQEDDMVIVWEDNGIGIPHEDKERIFERDFGKNTGLGLFLVREILEITGIAIVETGEPGKGARFEITVPKGAWRKAGERA